MEVTVRRAEPKDVPRMLELVKELAVFEREPEAVTVTEEEMREAGFGERPVWIGWVAEMRVASDEWRVASERKVSSGEFASGEFGGSEVVGMAVCYERYSTWKGRCLYLEDIVVTQHARGKGVGDKLFKACASFAVEQDFHHMLWQVLDWNEGAIRFYERYGAQISKEWLNARLERDQLVELI
jgi:ribosomal protein S18 acetylase RimI-like enzyme